MILISSFAFENVLKSYTGYHFGFTSQLRTPEFVWRRSKSAFSWHSVCAITLFTYVQTNTWLHVELSVTNNNSSKKASNKNTLKVTFVSRLYWWWKGSCHQLIYQCEARAESSALSAKFHSAGELEWWARHCLWYLKKQNKTKNPFICYKVQTIKHSFKRYCSSIHHVLICLAQLCKTMNSFLSPFH